jgi:tetratricopeptide (TPR) repeat protein
MASRHLSRAAAPTLRARALDEALKRNAGYGPARRAKVANLLDAIGARECAVETCGAAALHHVSRLEQQAPDEADTVILHARVLIALGREREADEWLSRGCPLLSGAERIACLRGRLKLLVASDSAPRASLFDAARSVAHEACSVGSCVKELVEAGDAFFKLDAWDSALAAYQKAALDAPNVTLFLRMADTAARTGRSSLVDSYLQRAERFARQNPKLKHEVQEKSRALKARGLLP